MRSTPAIVACLALLFLAAACSSEPPAAPAAASGPTSGAAPARMGGLVPDQALALARQAARAHGVKLEAFTTPQAAQLLIRNRRLCWAVVFVPAANPAGGAPAAAGFTIFVDDQTSAAEFVAGPAKAN